MMRLVSLAVIALLLVRGTTTERSSCEISACDVMQLIHGDLDMSQHFVTLERRVRALEQPVWRVSNSAVRWERCAAGPCRCRPEVGALTCWKRALVELPRDQAVPADARTIDLGANMLTTIHQDAFRGMTQLIELDLFDNQLDFLPGSLFRNLDTVRHLKLHKNRLETLPERIFEHLVNLLTLDLSWNNLHSLPPMLFRTTVRLRILQLSGNQLSTLPDELFASQSQLEELNLSENMITSLPEGVFRGLVSLRRLRLADNLLETLPAGIFDDLTSLETLSLRKNRLSALRPRLFQNQKSLTVLELTSNRITACVSKLISITSQGERSEPMDAILDSDLAAGFIGGFPLHLPLTSRWPSVVFEKLAAVDVATSKLIDTKRNGDQLSGDEFSSLSSLQELHLGQNLLEALPPGMLHGASSLRKLFLFGNQLTRLDSLALAGAANLSALFLSNNALRYVSPDAFSGLARLEKLQVDSNKFQFLPEGVLEYLRDLESIKLAKNPWHCDCAVLYVANWLRDNKRKVWDSNPKCRGPGDLGGRLLEDMTFNDLCEGQWASMVRLSPRIPKKSPEPYL